MSVVVSSFFHSNKFLLNRIWQILFVCLISSVLLIPSNAFAQVPNLFRRVDGTKKLTETEAKWAKKKKTRQNTIQVP